MNKTYTLKLNISVVILIIFGIVVSACTIDDSISWKEEVLLNNGEVLIVDRTQVYGSRVVIESKSKKLLRADWSFIIPNSAQRIKWSSSFEMPPSGDNLLLLQINILNGVPYIATRPAGCIAFNFWNRPNPSYVFFRYEEGVWKQISLAEFPREFVNTNVYVGRPDLSQANGLISIQTINTQNEELEPYLSRLIREPFNNKDLQIDCPIMKYDGKGSWRSTDGPKAPNQLPAVG